MLAAAQSLAIPPAQFWRLSLCEWRALTSPLQTSSLPRVAFDALAQRFPDTSNE